MEREQPEQEAFDTIKELLSNTPVLALYDPHVKMVVSVDTDLEQSFFRSKQMEILNQFPTYLDHCLLRRKDTLKLKNKR